MNTAAGMGVLLLPVGYGCWSSPPPAGTGCRNSPGTQNRRSVPCRHRQFSKAASLEGVGRRDTVWWQPAREHMLLLHQLQREWQQQHQH
jgi:hypothetical protein